MSAPRTDKAPIGAVAAVVAILGWYVAMIADLAIQVLE
jgi:hypothetical protein